MSREDGNRLLPLAASLARNASRLVQVEPVPLGFTDAPGAMIGRAGKMRVDKSSLLARVALAYLPSNAAEAREALNHPPAPPSYNCGDDTVADYRSYFQAAASIAESGFTAVEIAEGRRYAFLRSQSLNVRDPAAPSPPRPR